MKLKGMLGNSAEGQDHFFMRSNILEEITEEIENSLNLLIAAPRRVGKSTLLKYLANNPDLLENQYHIKYHEIESVDAHNELYKRLFNTLIEDKEILNKSSRYLKQASATAKAYVNKITSIGKEIKIDHALELDYQHEFESLLRHLESNKKIILIIDEFSQALENIRLIDEKEALRLLQTMRSIRQSPDHKDKIQFIYSGSIGLDNIVERMDSSKHINDLHVIEVPPLEESEACQLIALLSNGFKSNVEIPSSTSKYLLEKVEWTIPFYIQLMMNEIKQLVRKEELKKLDKHHVDIAFANICTNYNKYNIYFNHWKSRLKSAFEKNEYRFTLALLNHLSEKITMDKDAINDLAVAKELDEYEHILRILSYDGYIHKENKHWKFNSPILRTWWLENVAS